MNNIFNNQCVGSGWLKKYLLSSNFCYRPTEHQLKRWASSHWIEYQAWLFQHDFLSLNQWDKLRQRALNWSETPLISLVIPVYNTPPYYLQTCLYSVQTQAYPYWEVCLINDGSHHPATLQYLQRITQLQDPRIRLFSLSSNQGICAATNHGIAAARGDFIGFLDHDDRLAPQALFTVAEMLLQQPQTEIIYTDRDMLSAQECRFMHLFKPDWSPETLLSGNYLFHLVLYQRQLLQQLGGVYPEFEGSQDYDLILRASEKNRQIRHIPQVLYHWRQHQQSIAQVENAKTYTFSAGLRALEASLQRRQLVATVTENQQLWRGNYRVQLQTNRQYKVIYLSPLDAQYPMIINQNLQAMQIEGIDDLIILSPEITMPNETVLQELVAWLQIDAVAMVTGKIVSQNAHILHAGLVARSDQPPLAVYQQFPESTSGYMAVTSNLRNVSLPHPAWVAIKGELLKTLGLLETDYLSAYSLWDYALRSLENHYRIVYNPFARVVSEVSEPADWLTQLPANDCQRFTTDWQAWLQQGDPYYNPHLSLELVDMGLKI